MANSVMMGAAGCSSESSTSVSGLAPSRWFSSFWKSSCCRWRACSCAEGAIFHTVVRGAIPRAGIDKFDLVQAVEVS